MENKRTLATCTNSNLLKNIGQENNNHKFLIILNPGVRDRNKTVNVHTGDFNNTGSFIFSVR